MKAATFIFSASLLGACGAPPSEVELTLRDAGSFRFDAESFEPAKPELPQPPRAVVLTPCPAGWRELPATAERGAKTCEPWPESGRADCPPGQAHYLGEAGCAPVGVPCPSGQWPENLDPLARVFYVRSSTVVAGDGTIQAPFARIEQATAIAAPGTIIALAKGIHDGEIEIPAGVRVLGACAAETTIRATRTATVVIMPHPNAELANVRIEALYRGVMIGDPARVPWTDAEAAVLSGVELIRGEGRGVHFIEGATATIADSLITGTSIPDVPSTYSESTIRTRLKIERTAIIGGDAIWLVGAGLRAELDAVVISGALYAGLVVHNGAEVTVRRSLFDGGLELGIATGTTKNDALRPKLMLEDSIIRRHARAGIIAEGASVELARVLLAENSGIGLKFEPAKPGIDDTSLRARDLLIDDMTPLSGSRTFAGVALEVWGASAEIDRLLISDVYTSAIYVRDGTLMLRDAILERSQPRATDHELGVGIVSDSAAELTLERIHLRNHPVAGIVLRENTRATISDLSISDLQPLQTCDLSRPCGRGFDLEHLGSTATVTRALFERTGDVAVTLFHGAHARFEDLTIRNTLIVPSGHAGRGLGVDSGSRASIVRGHVARAGELALSVFTAGAELALTDVFVETTASQATDGTRGRAIHAQYGARVIASRVAIEQGREAGVSISEESTLEAHGLAIRNTRAQACAANTCADEPGGSALVVTSSSSAVVEQFIFENSALYGVQVGPDANVCLRHGRLVGNFVGVNVQNGPAEPRCFIETIRYENNGLTGLDELAPLPLSKLPSVPSLPPWEGD